MPRLQFSKIEGTEAGVEVKIECFGGSRLAIFESCELLAIPKQKFNLKAQMVQIHHRFRAQVEICGKQHDKFRLIRLASIVQVSQANAALQRDMPNFCGVKGEVGSAQLAAWGLDHIDEWSNREKL